MALSNIADWKDDKDKQVQRAGQHAEHSTNRQHVEQRAEHPTNRQHAEQHVEHLTSRQHVEHLTSQSRNKMKK